MGLPISGDVPSGNPDSGAPVKIGGFVNTSATLFPNGQRANVQMGQYGSVRTEIWGAGNNAFVAVTNPADALAAQTALFAVSQNSLYNGATFDRQRGNIDNAALITLAAAAPTTTNSADQTNYNGNKLKVVIDITAIATQTVVVTIQGKDQASGKYYTLLATTSLATTGTTVLDVALGTTVAANLAASTFLPRTWRINVVGSIGGTVSMTVGACVDN